MSLSPFRFLSGSAICLVTAVLLVILLQSPGTPLQSLIFIQDSLWGISWLFIARQSFLSRRSGYPPKAMAVTLGVELYLMVHYTFLFHWSSWLLTNYILWPLTSLFNLAAVLLFSRDEISPGAGIGKAAFRILAEAGAFFLAFRFIAGNLPQHLVMANLGQTSILIISLSFLFRVLRNDDLTGMSLSGNALRVLAGILCFVSNVLLRQSELHQHAYLVTVMTLSVLTDLAFSFVYLKKMRRSS